jgi:hypothetical protein
MLRGAPRAGPPPREPARNDQRLDQATEPSANVTHHEFGPMQPGRPADELARQLERRREAALRLPPLECGCRDPDTWQHRMGECRYPQRDVA